MKKLFTTFLMLCVALVTWGVNPPGDEPNALSIPDNGWNSSTGELTVYHSGVGKAGPAEWEAILSAKGISAGDVTKLNLTGKFDNKAIKEASGNGVLSKLTNTTLYLDLSGCEYAYCKYTGINEAGTAFTYQPTQGSDPITQTIHHSYTLRKDHVVESYNLRKEHVVESYTLRKETTPTYLTDFYGATFSLDFNLTNPDTNQEYACTATNINNPNHTQSGTLKYRDNKWYFWTDDWNNFEIREGTPKITYYNNETNEVVENVDESKLVATDTENIFTYVYNEYDKYTNTETNEVVENVDENNLVETDTENIFTYVYNEYDQYFDTTTDEVVENVDESKLVATDTENVYTYSYDEVVTLSDGTPFALNQDGRSKINGITFPDNEHFTYIPEALCTGQNADDKWTALTTLVFPNNIVAIGPKAFLGASALANITWSTNLQYIGLDVNSSEHVGPFQACTSLTTVNLSNTKVEVIGKDAFNATTNDNIQTTAGSLTSVTLPSTLKVIGGEAFHSTKITTAALAGCTKLEKLGFEAFENCTQLTTVTFPGKHTETVEGVTTETYYLTYFGNDAFKNTAITSIDLSMCGGITEFQHFGRNGTNEYLQFANCTNLTSVIFPPNLSVVPGNRGLFGDNCVNLSSITFTGTAAGYDANGIVTNPLVIEEGAFWFMKTSENKGKLSTVTFAENSNLYQIKANAFYKTEIVNLDLSMCHALRLLDGQAFAEITDLVDVKVCSHPKTIKGGQGGGAFYNSTAIRRVEITACDNITDITQCKCECGAFDQDVTYCGTDATFDKVEANAAVLVFPNTAPIIKPEGVNEYYTSPFDFFVGDYKAGSLIVQEGLQGYHKDVPNTGSGTYKYKDENGQDVWTSVTCNYQINDGWHEFIKTAYGEIIKKGEFLRTYSRSHGDGPCQLPSEITAYRAVDYKSTKTAYVLDKVGNFYLNPDLTDDPSTTDIDERIVAIPEVDGEYDEEVLADIQARNLKRYSYLTVGGILYLRPLIAKVAQYPGLSGGYTEENKEAFDSEEIYSNLTDVPGGHSYVPENTGVVLYSQNLNWDAFLVLGGDFGTETVYKEFPHTGDRFEEGRRNGGEGVNTDDDINMLQGSYDTGWTVAPVYPWLYSGQKTENSGDAPEEGVKYTKGHYSYKNPKAYRNFACTVINTASNGKKTYGWQRLQPSVMKVNRAFAQIPVNRFDNFNEGVDQMPDFTIEDMPTGTPSNSLMLIGMFEGEDNVVSADGIKTVNTVDTKVYDNAWYTLQGVRVSKPQMGGVYIHNGQKVVIK